MTDRQSTAIEAVVRDVNMLLISDEVYAEYQFSGSHISILTYPDMQERILLVSGFSKSMAGCC